MSDRNPTDFGSGLDIAIIGMAGRFPKARNLEEFWQNLKDGVEAITFFEEADLDASTVVPALVNAPNYVKAGAVLEDIELFDASFFGFTPREARLTDPQHRVFLECAWDALENAGYYSEAYKGAIGVYAGASSSTYLYSNIFRNLNAIGLVNDFQLSIGNDRDYLPTRISYKLNLTGPSINIQSACSTSLVAVHLACQGLLSGECDMALAGGVTIAVPQNIGYLYEEGGINSPDGHCRAFDAKAAGTVSGNGAGVVVLKRLADALADGDCIQAIIKGSAINNDGSLKVGFTAPSLEGQAKVIGAALALADIDVESIRYVEAHGTGTALGDPIEIAALTRVFRATSDKKSYCTIGSVKTNVGHLDAAAGVAGLMKTVLAIKHKTLPPSLHFQQPNPRIDFANSPFFVCSRLTEWESNGEPRRAAVSSFGIGGTNAHAIIEEAPETDPSTTAGPWQLLVLSARTEGAVEIAAANLSAHLCKNSSINLADVAYTLQVGRKPFNTRLALICSSGKDAIGALESRDLKRVLISTTEGHSQPVTFMFPGQGSQHIRMAAELYQQHDTFREQVDYCSELLVPHLGFDLRDILYPSPESEHEASEKLNETLVTQPALFVIEYALAKFWMEMGIVPQAMIGHSIGEYVAACIAGVISLEDALALIALRGRLIQGLQRGVMLSVPLPEQDVRAFLCKELSIAAVNAPQLSVVSGSEAAVEAFSLKLAGNGIVCKRLRTSHAFHSQMMTPIVEEFISKVKTIKLGAAQIPFLSNVSGTWIKESEAANPAYWGRHLRETVRFSDGLQELLKVPKQILLEVGPGQTLSALAKRHNPADQLVVSSSPSLQSGEAQQSALLKAIARLFLAGADPDWKRLYAGQRRLRVPLPTYPFERQRYWIDSQTSPASKKPSRSSTRKNTSVNDWFYMPTWKQLPALEPVDAQDLDGQKATWLLFMDELGIGSLLANRLELLGQEVMTVAAGEKFLQTGDRKYEINPQQREDYDALIDALRAPDKAAIFVVHLWNVTPSARSMPRAELFNNRQMFGFYSLIYLAQALLSRNITTPVELAVVSNGVQKVSDHDLIEPEKATLLGACKVIPQEYPSITCRSIDLNVTKPGIEHDQIIDDLLAEIVTNAPDPIVAYRGRQRWVQEFESLSLNRKSMRPPRLRERGVYLITGGLGSIGLQLAEFLATSVRARLILSGRSALPGREEWQSLLSSPRVPDRVRQTIDRLRRLEETGAEILVVRADVANHSEMEQLIAESDNRFGEINGVFHAAGPSGDESFLTLMETNPATCERHFQPKAYGLYASEKLFEDQKLDFCILFSSLASIIGGLGFAAYSAANSFMDAFARHRNTFSAYPWISLNIDGWQSELQAASTAPELSITAAEGVQVFERLLSIRPMDQLVVSTADLRARVEQWTKLRTQRGDQVTKQTDKPAPHSRRQVQFEDEIEGRIAQLWQALLGTDSVAAHDDFFDLGGDSLLAIQLLARIRETFQVNLSVRQLFDNSTVGRLAVLVRDARPHNADFLMPPIVVVPRTEPLALSFAQQRLWLLDQFEPGNPAYNIPAVVRLTGNLDLSVLQKALDEIIRRHEVFRSSFPSVDGLPVQVINELGPLAILIEDLDRVKQSERESVALRLAKEEVKKPFDLSRGPLIRAKLLRLANDEHIAVLTLHHIIFDDWSLGVLVKELAVIYEAYSQGKPSPLADLPIQYADYAQWERQWLQGGVLEKKLAFWKKQVEGVPSVLELPTDRARPAMLSYQGATEFFSLSADTSDLLKDIARQQGATLFMTLLAGYQALLHRYTGQDALTIGSPSGSRVQPETEGLIGCFINTMVLRADVSGNPTFRELLARVRERILEVYAHQDLPFDLLVEALQPERKSNYSALFQVWFVLQNAPVKELELPGIRLDNLPVDAGTTQFDLALSMVEVGREIQGALTYSTDLFNADTVCEMINHFKIILQVVADNPERRILEIPMYGESQETYLNTRSAAKDEIEDQFTL